MPVEYLKTVARLEGEVSVDDAEQLYEWLLENPKAKINLKTLSHPHSAVLQVLMALRPGVSATPDDEAVGAWLMPAIAEEPPA